MAGFILTPEPVAATIYSKAGSMHKSIFEQLAMHKNHPSKKGN
jgi:hypothetical protein